MGELIERMLSLVKEHRLGNLPRTLTLLGRSMGHDGGNAGHACARTVNILQILSMHMSTLLLKELDIKKLLRHKGRQLYTSMDKSMEIPAQISDLLNITKNGQAQLNLQLSDSEEIRADIHKTADRFILSILAAALFIGSGMIIHVRTIPQWFGIPWISFLGYTVSGVMIVGLIVRILLARR